MDEKQGRRNNQKEKWGAPKHDRRKWLGTRESLESMAKAPLFGQYLLHLSSGADAQQYCKQWKEIVGMGPCMETEMDKMDNNPATEYNMGRRWSVVDN